MSQNETNYHSDSNGLSSPIDNALSDQIIENRQDREQSKNVESSFVHVLAELARLEHSNEESKENKLAISESRLESILMQKLSELVSAKIEAMVHLKPNKSEKNENKEPLETFIDEKLETIVNQNVPALVEKKLDEISSSTPSQQVVTVAPKIDQENSNNSSESSSILDNIPKLRENVAPAQSNDLENQHLVDQSALNEEAKLEKNETKLEEIQVSREPLEIEQNGQNLSLPINNLLLVEPGFDLKRKEKENELVEGENRVDKETGDTWAENNIQNEAQNLQTSEKNEANAVENRNENSEPQNEIENTENNALEKQIEALVDEKVSEKLPDAVDEKLPAIVEAKLNEISHLEEANKSDQSEPSKENQLDKKLDTLVDKKLPDLVDQKLNELATNNQDFNSLNANSGEPQLNKEEVEKLVQDKVVELSKDLLLQQQQVLENMRDELEKETLALTQNENSLALPASSESFNHESVGQILNELVDEKLPDIVEQKLPELVENLEVEFDFQIAGNDDSQVEKKEHLKEKIEDSEINTEIEIEIEKKAKQKADEIFQQIPVKYETTEARRKAAQEEQQKQDVYSFSSAKFSSLPFVDSNYDSDRLEQQQNDNKSSYYSYNNSKSETSSFSSISTKNVSTGSKSGKRNYQWPDAYFNIVFDQIDLNGDGKIAPNELHESFKRVYSNPRFDSKTVAILFELFDKNRDGRLDYDEYRILQESLSKLHKEFLETDFRTDSNGLMDARELSKLFKQKGYNFSSHFASSLVHRLIRDTPGAVGLKFDKYLYLISRVEQLLSQIYRRHSQASLSLAELENIILSNF